MLKKLTGLTIILSPFTSYLALSAWLRLPVILFLILISLFTAKILLARKLDLSNCVIKKHDVFLLILLAIVWVSFIFGFKELRSLNHALAYTFTFIVYYFILRFIVLYQKISWHFILKMIAYSAIVCSVIIILDWLLINIFNIGFREYFVDIDKGTANMYYYRRQSFTAVGGVAEEPGSMALFMNILSPLAILYYKIEGRRKSVIIMACLYIVSLFCLFSSAGIVNLIVATCGLLTFNLLAKRRILINKNHLILGVFLFLILTIFLILFYHKYSPFLVEINQKLFMSNENESSITRSFVWSQAFKDWSSAPFLGNGPGYGVDKYKVGYHSVYFTILADIGLFGFLSFLFFLMFNLKNVIHRVPLQRVLLGIPFIATFIHFAIVGDFFHAPFWILIILIQLMPKNYSKKSFTV